MRHPLPIPDDFNPTKNLIAKQTENGTFHESRQGARFAEELVANGTPADLELAHKVLDATLACQEVHLDDPHRGNFYWMAEDEVVTDLNAVEFNLERLIPMMIQHSDRLSSTLQARILEAIRLGLEEIHRLDVHVAYSNITMLDILNSCLGGELLQDSEISQRGYDKLVQWMTFTDESGIPREYNSPTYTPVIIRALKRLTDLTTHDETRINARTFATRIGLSALLHIHHATGRWTGPHSRVYQPSVVCERPPEIEMVRDWLQDGHLPEWLSDLLAYPSLPFEVRETASIHEGLGLTTYQSSNFALGTASKEYGGQSDVLMAHYVRDGADRPGVLYSRYVMDDKWLGDFYHATDRTTSRNLIEEGRFLGVQNGASAIGLYAPKDMSHCHSAKATFIFTQSKYIDEIWVNGQQIDQLPIQLQEKDIVVIGSGRVYIAIQPLSRHDAGRPAPIQLIEKQGDLVLEVYNYQGAEKDFWEMRPSLNPFFQGHPYCAVYVEVADRSLYADGHAFSEYIASGELDIQVTPPFTTDFMTERPITISYTRDGRTLGLKADLMKWSLIERWTEKGILDYAMLESPLAKGTQDGKITLNGATLVCDARAAWLYANSETNLWVVGIHNNEPVPLNLTLPEGSVELDAMGTGTIVWDKGNVAIQANDIHGTPKIEGGQLV